MFSVRNSPGTQNAIAKSRTLLLQNCFIHIFLIRTEVPFKEEVLGVYTSPFLDTDELKIVLRARNVSGAFEKRAADPISETEPSIASRGK